MHKPTCYIQSTNNVHDFISGPRNTHIALSVVFSCLLGIVLFSIVSVGCCGCFQYYKRRLRKLQIKPTLSSGNIRQPHENMSPK